MALKVGELYATISADNTKFVKAVKDSKVSLGDLGNAADRSLGKIGQWATGIGRYAAMAAAAMAAAGAAGSVAALKLASDWEQAEMSFATLLGSVEAAKAYMEELQEFAAKTPFELPGLIGAAQKLMAFGFAAESVVPMMTNIGDAVAGMGGSPEVMNRIIIALGQMKAKQKVSAEEMLQLTEANIGAWQMLADKIGKTVPETMKLAEKGAISAETAIVAILEGMGQKFGGLMDKQSKTLGGLWSTLRDSASNALRKIGLLIAESFDLRGVMQKAAEWIDRNEQRFAEWGRVIIQAIKDVIGGLGDFVAGLLGTEVSAGKVTEAFGKVLDVAGDLGKWFKDHAGPIAETLAKWLPIVAALAGAFLALAAAQRIAALWSSILAVFAAIMTKNGKAIATAALMAASAITAFYASAKAIKDVKGMLTDLGKGQYSVKVGGTSGIGDSIDKIKQDWASLFGGTDNPLASVGTAAVSAGKQIADGIGDGIQAAFDKVRDYGQRMTDYMGDEAKSMVERVKDAFNASQDAMMEKYRAMTQLGAAGLAAIDKTVSPFAKREFTSADMPTGPALRDMYSKVLQERAFDKSLNDWATRAMFGPMVDAASNMQNAVAPARTGGDMRDAVNAVGVILELRQQTEVAKATLAEIQKANKPARSSAW